MRAGSTPYSRLALAALVAAVYAGCYSAIRAGLPFSPPFRYAGLRALIGGTVLLALLAARREPLLPTRRLWPAVLALALIGTLFGFGAMFTSQQHTGAGLASVLGNTGPLIVIVLAAIFLAEPITRAKAAALLLGTTGVLLIALSGVSGGRAGTSVGALIPLVAALSGASASVIVKRARLGTEVLSVTAWQFLVGSIPLLLLSASTERDRSIQWTPQFLFVLLFLALPGTAFATALWYWLLQRDDVGRLTLVLFLVPVIGLMLGMALFAERLSAMQGVGVGLALAACGIAAAFATKRQPS